MSLVEVIGSRLCSRLNLYAVVGILIMLVLWSSAWLGCHSTTPTLALLRDAFISLRRGIFKTWLLAGLLRCVINHRLDIIAHLAHVWHFGAVIASIFGCARRVFDLLRLTAA